MINAGMNIKPFDGSQAYDSPEGIWRGIKIDILYPTDQDSTNNPPDVGDKIIENNGHVWEVQAVTPVSGSTFEVDLKLKNKTPEESLSPSLGISTRGAIVTPKNGRIIPHWDPSKVSSVIQAIASNFNIAEEEDGAGMSPIDNATLSSLQTQVAANTSAIAELEPALDEILGA